MRRPDGRDKSSIVFVGKGTIILALVVASSLTFLLGYFVGKSMNSPGVNRTQASSAFVPSRPGAAGAPEQKAEPEQSVRMTVQDPGQTQTTETAGPQEKAEKQGSKPKDVKRDTNEKHSTQERKADNGIKTRKYTVQAGAFKNESDAQALKAELEKKGYKSNVTASQGKNRERLFKVIVGTFAVRKDAEILALKLKKSAGLKAFVTFH
ncbi:MAG: SPOR domain-containing protein [Nitrospirota bacterium]